MSYTEIFKFKEDGNAEMIAEIHNAHRGAMAIWVELGKKYNTPFSLFSPQKVWGLQNKNIDITDKICLLSTFDNVVIKKENLNRLISAFRDFSGNTSLKEQADVIENEFKKHNNLLGIAFNQTSVNGDNWESGFGSFDEDNQEYLPYNILEDNDRHWFLFSDLNLT